MSVVSVTEIFEEHDGEITIEGHQWYRAFHVRTDDKTQWGPAILLAYDPSTGLRIPRIGEVLKVDAGGFGADDIQATAQRLRPQRVDGTPCLWRVVVEYSTRPTITQGEIDPNPFTRPPDWAWGDMASSEEYTHDADGVAVLNTALEPYDPGLMREITRHTLTVSWNVKTFDPIAAAEYADAVNESEFTVLGLQVAEGVAKVAHNTATGSHFEGRYEYARRTVELHFRPFQKVEWHDGSIKWVSGWDHTPLSMGFSQRVNKKKADGTVLLEKALVPILLDVVDDDGKVTGEKVRPQEPVALDEAGKAIEGDDPAFVKHYKPYRRMDFQGLGLP